MNIKLSAPKQITFWIAVAVAVIGVIAKLANTAYGGWLLIVAFVILAAGVLLENL